MRRDTTALDEAFKMVNRADFLPSEEKNQAGFDEPLPIGYGQTNSQPTTVRMMLEWLDARSGDRVLDVGSGSGWTTALLSQLVGPRGQIYAVERVPELVKFGQENCQRAGVKNAEFFTAGRLYGLPQHAPYDRILVSASAQKLPKELLQQLRVGGKMVIPVVHDVLEISKVSDDTYKTQAHPGFAFVPLI